MTDNKDSKVKVRLIGTHEEHLRLIRNYSLQYLNELLLNADTAERVATFARLVRLKQESGTTEKETL